MLGKEVAGGTAYLCPGATASAIIVVATEVNTAPLPPKHWKRGPIKSR